MIEPLTKPPVDRRGANGRARHIALMSMLGVLIVGAVVTTVVVPAVRARQRSDWFVSKNLALAPVITGLKEPTYVTGSPDGTRFFVLERGGLVRVADHNGQLQSSTFLDLSQQVSLGNEEGLLGLAFHPAFNLNGHVYVSYTSLDWALQVVRYSVPRDRPNQADPTTAQTVLTVPKRSKYHNGGMLAFGPDGYLYISSGDDEASERAQDLGSLAGKILRIDVDSAEPYAIPPSNPFAGTDARGEIWSYGLRNPWRFSFDRATGDMWIGDVHHVDGEQGLNWETVQFQPASSAGGENYGFPMQTTFHCADVATCRPEGVTLPVTHYDHNMNCSISGGYVYRGKQVGGLVGVYLFGDLCTGGVYGLSSSTEQPWSKRLELGFQPIKITSFGEDAEGEVYVADYQGGVIYRVVEGSLP